MAMVSGWIYVVLILDSLLPLLFTGRVSEMRGEHPVVATVFATLCWALWAGIVALCFVLKRSLWARRLAIVVTALAIPAWGLIGLIASVPFALMLHGMEGTGAQWWPGLVASAIVFGPIFLLPNILAVRSLSRVRTTRNAG